MNPTLSLWQEFLVATVQEIPKLFTGAALIALAWIGSRKFTDKWNLQQKARELDLTASNDFHALYGEFFAVWKLWNAFSRDIGEELLPGSSRWELLKRATDAEGRMEAMLVRVVSSKKLSAEDEETLGQFRQLYQQLREAIRANVALAWDASSHPDYTNFKQLAPRVALLIRDVRAEGRPALNDTPLSRITDNRHEPPRIDQ
jgi:hypothetical protein